MRYDVFISYSSKDQKIAEGICGYLESNGYRCFVAYRDIPRGVVWAGAIADAIDESKMMVVVFSSNFNLSSQTDREIELAADNNIPILTYRISEVKLTGAKRYYLKNLNWIDAFPSPERYFGKLKESISLLIFKDVESSKEIDNCTPSGLRYQIMKDGYGLKPNINDSVTIHYEGFLTDGTVIFSSIQRGQPEEFQISQLIKGLAEGIQLMKEGSKARFVIPPELAYVDTDYGTIPPNSTIIIDCELIKVVREKSQNDKCIRQKKYNHLTRFRSGDRWGFMTGNDEIVIPCTWKYCGDFYYGLAAVEDEKGFWGYINMSGTIVVPCQWKYASRFKEGLARVKNSYGQWGYIDVNGKTVITFMWEDASDFSGGKARVKDLSGKDYWIDKRGTVIR